jgi:hypothetical protein
LELTLKENDSMSYVGLIVTVIISLFFVFNNLGWEFVSGHAAYWNIQDNDITQHLSGLNFYLSSPWQFPLLAFDSLNYPQGTRVTFVDGIPIFAFLLKVFLRSNIGYINPMGYWITLSFILQGVAGWWISRELKVKSWIFLICIVLTFLSYPVFINRIGHVALMSHWVILFAIALYLHGNRLQRVAVAGWICLIFCAFYIHIYLFVMALGIYMAAVLNIRHKLTWRYSFSVCLPLIILGLSWFVFLLPLPLAPVQIPQDIDHFATNILSPFHGEKLRLFNFDNSHSPMGFNNIGLGVIVIFVWCLFSRPLENLKMCKQHWALFTIMLCFFVFSLSSKIYFGGHLVASFTYPEILKPIVYQIRACGRFFWPVGYTIVVFSLYTLYLQLKSKKVFFLVIMCAFLLTQYFDISGDYDNLRQARDRNPVMVFQDFTSLDKILGSDIKYLYLYPKYDCSGRKDHNFHFITPMMQYAAMHQLKLNTGFVSRYGSNCPNTHEEIAESDHGKSAYIFSKDDFPDIQEVLGLMGDAKAVNCNELESVYICKFKQ